MQQYKMESKKRGFVYFASFSVNLMTMVCGIAYGWTSPALPKLRGEMGPDDNPLYRPTSVLEDSWIVAFQSLGAGLCSLFLGPVANKYGRKNTLMAFSLPMIASNLILIFANSVYQFYISRFLVGIGTGCVFSIIPLYVAEISNVEDRGFTSVFLSAMLAVSQLLAYLIGPYTTIRTLAIFSLVPSVFFLISFGFFIPESPYYFILVNKRADAVKSIQRLWQISETLAEKEVLDIINTVEESKTNTSIKKIIKSKIVFKSLLISIGLMTCQQFSGILAVLSYMQTIFDATNTNIPGDLSAIMVGVLQVISTLLTSRIVDVVNRKTLLLTSNIGMFVSLTSLGAFFYLETHGVDVNIVFWVPIASLILFIISYNLGMGPLVWTIVGEIFPPNLKTYLNGICSFSCFICGFIISMTFPNISLILGMAWSFWMFAIVTVISTIFIVFYVPETRGRTFLDIQRMLRDGKMK